jgi:hypothetical protein
VGKQRVLLKDGVDVSPEAGVRETSSPSRKIFPEVGDSNPAIMRRVVVLPQPEGPSIEKNDPRSMPKQASCTATKSAKRLAT